MREYPKCLYRDGTAFEWEGRTLDGITVEDAVAEERARADGFVGIGEAPNPLDHDSDGKPGGSLKGEESTVARGRRKKAAQ